LLLKILPKQHTQAGRFPLLIFSTFALDARGQLTRLGYKVTNKAKCKILSRTRQTHLPAREPALPGRDLDKHTQDIHMVSLYKELFFNRQLNL